MKAMQRTTQRELVEALHEAQEKMRETVELLQWVADATGDRNAEAYIVDHLRILTSEDHGFVSRDLNLDDWIRRVEDTERE